MRIFLFLFLILTIAGPLLLIMSGKIDFYADYRTANRESAGIAPNPSTTPEAVIQVYSARAFNWRGIFAVHIWLATKEKGAKTFTVYQVIGWRLFRNLPPVVKIADIPDRNWFNQKPSIILDIRGPKAEKIIPEIAKAADSYPYQREYFTWPGPNSNTFIAYIARQIPALRLALPGNAMGKDFLPHAILAPTPSGTGYQLSLYGVLGVAMGIQEGLEVNILGLVYGINPMTLTIKLPGFGDITMLPT